MRTLLIATFMAMISLPAAAATRLTYAMGTSNVPVYWPKSAFPLTYSVDRRVTITLPEGAVDRAFGLWSSVPDADIRFTDLGSADGLKAGKDGKNVVTMTDDLFANQKAIAVTSNWYDSRGQLTEADIQLDTSLARSDYNIQTALAHEIGHVLGLDHSAVISAVMYPYVTRGTEAPSLDSDERVAIAAIYPKTDPTLVGGTLQGRVIGDGGGIFAAQVVAVNAAGEPVTTALTNSTGDFELRGIPPGKYRLYAEPLDGPVDTRNLSGVWRSAKIVSFPTRFSDTPEIQVDTGRIVGNLIMNVSGTLPAALNPKWVGFNNTGADSFNLSTTAVSLKPGQTVTIAIAGDGFTSGMTKFEILSPGFQRQTDFRYSANYVFATFNVDATAPPGSAVILVTSGNQNATLTGALRVAAGPSRSRAVRR